MDGQGDRKISSFFFFFVKLTFLQSPWPRQQVSRFTPKNKSPDLEYIRQQHGNVGGRKKAKILSPRNKENIRHQACQEVAEDEQDGASSSTSLMFESPSSGKGSAR